MDVWTPAIDRSASQSLTEVAYRALNEAIFDRNFPPGGRLGIDDAAKRLGMSITPVREALARLASEGLITQTANKGFTVAPLLTPNEFHALFTARRVLETEAIRARPDGTGAAARILDPALVDEAALDRMADVSRLMREAGRGPTYGSYGRFSALDNMFHQALVELGGNRFLSNAWRGLHFHLHVSRLYAGAGVIDFDQATAEHESIVRAARHRDGAALATEAAEHIIGAEKRLERLLDPRSQE
ncbi:MAG: GntR family transcriptional regulator [Microlunatus sp.]|nr:GntR family transcriptional regulator [Microlunatus sp.]